jgi:hypothetical protein
MKPMARRKTLVQQMAEESAKYVVSVSTRAAIDKIGEDFARDALADPVFRAHLKREATAAAREVVARLREVNPELHGVKKKRPRRVRAAT